MNHTDGNPEEMRDLSKIDGLSSGERFFIIDESRAFSVAIFEYLNRFFVVGDGLVCIEARVLAVLGPTKFKGQLSGGEIVWITSELLDPGKIGGEKESALDIPSMRHVNNQ